MRTIARRAAGWPYSAWGWPCSSAAPAGAHHGWSAYDAAKPVKIEAPVAEVQWRNPHAEIALPWQGGNWNVVLAPLNRMESRGLPGPLTPGQRRHRRRLPPPGRHARDPRRAHHRRRQDRRAALGG